MTTSLNFSDKFYSLTTSLNFSDKFEAVFKVPKDSFLTCIVTISVIIKIKWSALSLIIISGLISKLCNINIDILDIF